MVVSKDKLSRRKSIAVPTQTSSLRHTDTRRKRRAHSIAPSKIISPLSRSRLSLGPVKGILKGVRRKSNESQNHDDPNATQSIDMTNQDNSLSQPSRQSLVARRVSFSSTAHVRLFGGSKRTSSAFEAADSSGEAPSSDDHTSNSPQKPAPVNDENAYPSASGRNRKSIRFSVAGSDMDLTSASAGAFLQGGRAESDLLDEEMDDDDDDMDVTQVHGNVFRKRSLSTHVRAPLTQLSSNPPGVGESSSDDPSKLDDLSHSFASEQSINSESDQSGVEFTVPLNQALRPPQENEAWVALVQATHSGAAQEPSCDNSMEDMEVDSPVKSTRMGDGSISDGSFDQGFDDGNETINVSKVLGRFSFGDTTRRESMAYSGIAYLESVMDEDSEIYGKVIGIAATSTPRPSVIVPPSSNLPEPELSPPESRTDRPPKDTNVPPPTVFSRPTEQLSTAPLNRSGSPKKPKSPIKLTPKGFSAAFAPPVTKPIPRKSLTAPGQQNINLEKCPSDVGITSPSPAKRQALATKWASSVTASPQLGHVSTTTEQPRPLSPSKKVAFQALSASQTSQNATATSTQKPVSSIRRPSGYLARRKSLGMGLGATTLGEDVPSSTVARTSPKKKAGIGLGRVSMGSGASDAWKRFNKDGATQTSGSFKGKGKESVPPTVVVTPAQELPVDPHELPEDVTMALEQDPTPTQVMDLSALLEDDGFGDEEREHPPEDNLQATEHWREQVPQEGYVEGDIPSISVEQFFEMTDIKFMDEITVPRKSIHPELRRHPRSQAEIPLAEYVVAMGVDVPKLALYSRVARDLEGWLEKSKSNFKEADIEAAQMTPELFIEYARADEEGQAELHHQLNLIKTNTRLLAKSDWIEWKLQWVESLRATAQESFANLEDDAKVLEQLKAQTDEIVPILQEEYDEIMRELEKERQEIYEIEQCDQEYLNELKASIAEQNLELDSLKNDLKENNDQLHWVQGRLEDLESQKQETLTAIEKADRYMNIQKNSTHSEVLRLKAELEVLESLHMFRICKVNSRLFEYVFAEHFRVTIPCNNHVPLVDKVDITRTHDARSKVKDNFPRLSDLLLAGAKQVVHNLSSANNTVTTRHIVQSLTDYWSSCAQVRGQLLHLSVKYPIEIEVIPQSLGFKAHAEVLFPAVKGKAVLSLVFGSETYACWPATIGTLRCEVKVAYGNLDGRSILDAMRGRLSQATPSDNYACLLDACIEAQEH